MPKAPAQSPAPARAPSSVNALKRNQACHQCRRKKLKCDAQSPCSACVKTHAYALKTHPATTPPTPDCTFDGSGDDSAAQARLQEMEAKIRELESKLQVQSPPAVTSWPSGPTPPGGDFTAIPSPPNMIGTLFGSSPGSSNSNKSPVPVIISPTLPVPLAVSLPSSTSGTPSQGTSQNLHDINLIFKRFPNTGNHSKSPPSASNPPNPGRPSPFLDILDINWPANVPGPDLLHHLVDTFFACVPHATRVLHRPTFLASLLESPSSPKFPHRALLHSICALASLYTPIISDTTGRTMADIGPDSLFNSAIVEKRWLHPPVNGCPPTNSARIEEGAFGMSHADYYAEAWLEAARKGDRLPQLLQATLIICWYYHSVGRAVDTWMMIGNCCRTALPMGLNTGPLWSPISRQPVETLSMFPKVANVTEKELMRNLFWLCYTQERLYCAGTVWPLGFQDDDVTQYLPLSTETIAHKFVSDRERQRLSSPKLLVTHPPVITDSFSLYVKACVLLGRVKVFNGRFKNRFDEGPPEGIDPRETAEFQMLDNSITAFKTSIPREFKEPVGSDGKLDPTLYVTLVIPHVAMLLLHDPHADLESPNCLSAERLLTGARAILDLIYQLTATSFDLMLLDHSCSFCWFVAATALIRFLKVRIMAGDEPETTRLSSEIQVIRFMMSNLSARTIIGLRQNMILDEMYAAEVQPLIDKIVATAPTAEELNAAAGFFGIF